MARNAALLMVTALFALTLCACGSNGGTGSDSGSQDAQSVSSASESQAAEYDPSVEAIDLSLEGGSIRYDHVEKANEGLTTEENAFVFVFEFTNKQSEPAQVQQVFRIQAFQNGAELTKNPSYSSAGGDQYELVGAFFGEAMKDGKVTFGKIVCPQDDSPITIMVGPNGARENNYQTMEVPIDSLGSEAGSKTDAAEASTAGAAAGATAEEVDAALQGTWAVGPQGMFTFDEGTLSVEGQGMTLVGTYEVDAASSQIVAHVETTDGSVKFSLPYEFDGSALKFYNSEGNEATKQ